MYLSGDSQKETSSPSIYGVAAMIIMIKWCLSYNHTIQSYRWQAGKIGLAASGFNNTIQQYRYLCASLRRRGGVEQLRSGKRGECGGTRRHWQGAALSGRSLSTKALETTHDEFKIISSHIISYHIDLWVSNLGSQQNTWEITIILVIIMNVVIITNITIIVIVRRDLYKKPCHRHTQHTHVTSLTWSLWRSLPSTWSLWPWSSSPTWSWLSLSWLWLGVWRAGLVALNRICWCLHNKLTEIINYYHHN